ncbi:hypothetical protein CSA57_01045 [candidate division KSB3 bacterium]|nr:MAG: hypothetical protein CSA57_01045 [candidate division KSB3 bacterium]
MEGPLDVPDDHMTTTNIDELANEGWNQTGEDESVSPAEWRFGYIYEDPGTNRVPLYWKYRTLPYNSHKDHMTTNDPNKGNNANPPLFSLLSFAFLFLTVFAIFSAATQAQSLPAGYFNGKIIMLPSSQALPLAADFGETTGAGGGTNSWISPRCQTMRLFRCLCRTARQPCSSADKRPFQISD